MDRQIQIQDEDLAKTIEVLKLQFKNPEKSITELCDEVGLNRRQYYRKLDSGEEILQLLRTFIRRARKIELANIAAARHKIVSQLISSSLNTQDIYELVASLTYLDKLGEKLQREIGVTPGQEDAAQEFLRRGPHTKRQESRLVSVKVSEDEDGSTRLDFMKDEDAPIDITPEEVRDIHEPE